jgi:hypothetical protein
MRRALAAVVALGLLSVLAAGLLDDRERAFTVGLPAVRVAAELQPGERACRAGIDVPADFSRVRFAAASFGRPGPALTVTAGSARGTVAAGYPDNSTVEARVGDVREGQRIEVCVTNSGDSRVALYGSPPDTPPPYLDDPGREPALGFTFLRDEPRSMAALVPRAFERASRFHPAWIGAWTFWVLLGAVAAGLPALLLAAYRSTATDSTEASEGLSPSWRSTRSSRSASR